MKQNDNGSSAPPMNQGPSQKGCDVIPGEGHRNAPAAKNGLPLKRHRKGAALIKRDIYDPQTIHRMEKEKKMALLRAEVLAKPSEKALDAVLEAPFPTALIQSFPDQDLHFLMHHIGEDDFLPILSRATSSQWEYLLDVAVWHRDQLNPVAMTRMIGLLYKADPQRLLRWSIMEKPDFMEYYLFRHLEIRVREHDEDPSDFGEGFETLDSIIYFRFPLTLERNASSSEVETESNKEGDSSGNEGMDDANDDYTDDEINAALKSEMIKDAEAVELLITEMLNTLADMDLSVYQGLLMETTAVIPSETEEEQFRLRNVRLAEKGFLPYHEAVAIYQPLDPANMSERPAYYLDHSLYADDLPLPPQFPFSSVTEKSLFVTALAQIDTDVSVNLQSEFAFLVNALISTEKAPIRSIQELEKSVEKCCGYLSIGIEKTHAELVALHMPLELISELTPDAGAQILLRYPLKELFRVGSGASIALNQQARDWYIGSWLAKHQLHLSFLDEAWLGIAGGTLLDRPMYFDNYQSGELYKAFSSLDEIQSTAHELSAIALVDKLFDKIDPDPLYFTPPFVTWKAVLLTLWVKDRMADHESHGSIDFIQQDEKSLKNEDNAQQVDPFIPMSRFKQFFSQLFFTERKVRIASNEDEIQKQDDIEKKRGIGAVVREDFILWLKEQGAWPEGDGADDIDDAVRSEKKILERVVYGLFDELEDEYGSVSVNDLTPDSMPHFLLN